jgi:hypothetical protein
MGESAKMPSGEQSRLVGDEWDKIPGTRARQVRLVVYRNDGRRETFSLGVHAPELTPADLDLIHELWLKAYHVIGPDVHHRDIVTTALHELATGLLADQGVAILARLKERIRKEEGFSRQPPSGRDGESP